MFVLSARCARGNNPSFGVLSGWVVDFTLSVVCFFIEICRATCDGPATRGRQSTPNLYTPGTRRFTGLRLFLQAASRKGDPGGCYHSYCSRALILTLSMRRQNWPAVCRLGLSGDQMLVMFGGWGADRGGTVRFYLRSLFEYDFAHSVGHRQGRAVVGSEPNLAPIFLLASLARGATVLA